MEPFKIDRYLCIENVGSGKTTIVYRAILHASSGFEKTFSIKKIHNVLAGDSETTQRFFDWAAGCSPLDHGNIVKIIELGEHRGGYFAATEYVNGIDLSRILKRLKRIERVMPWEIAVFICIEAANALKYAHGLKDESGRPAGIVHGNLTPSKIMLARHGELKILGFASAKIRGIEGGQNSKTLRFKYPYMSPERLRSDEESPAEDIFSLGCLLFEMLTGSRLFSSETPVKVIRMMERDKMPPIPGIKPFLDPILRKMLARKPGDRFKSATELLIALTSVIVQRKRRVTEAHLSEYLKLFPETIRTGGFRKTDQGADSERTMLYRPDAAARSLQRSGIIGDGKQDISPDYDQQETLERRSDPSASDDEEETFVQGEEPIPVSVDLSDLDEEETFVQGEKSIRASANLSGLDEENIDDEKTAADSPGALYRKKGYLKSSGVQAADTEPDQPETVDPRLADFDDDWKTVEQNIRRVHGDNDQDEDSETVKKISVRKVFNLGRGKEFNSGVSDDSKQLDTTDEMDQLSLKKIFSTTLWVILIAVFLLGGAAVFYLFWGREWWAIPWLESILNR